MLGKLYSCRGSQSNTLIIQFSQRHGYCTLGEAFNRLDFCSAIKDTRRFNYIVRVSVHLSFLPGFFVPLVSLWWQKGAVLSVVERGLRLKGCVGFRQPLINALQTRVWPWRSYIPIECMCLCVFCGRVGVWHHMTLCCYRTAKSIWHP